MEQGYYEKVYLKRLNRYGIDFQSRMQRQREENFKLQLLRSVYYVTFDYDGKECEGEFTPMKQNETKTLHYLLTDVNLDMPGGTILMMPDKDGIREPWMVYYLEDYRASGYNRYIVIRADLVVDIDGHKFNACLIGPGHSYMRDVIKSRAATTIYLEDFNSFLLILPKTQYIKKDTYLTIGKDWEKTGFRVTGFDLFTNPDVEYVTLDPMYIKDETEAPTKTEEDSDEDYFWLNGGR